MNPIQQHINDIKVRVDTQASNVKLLSAAKNFTDESIKSGYSYNFSWMGRPIIQYPQDLIAMQEIIWGEKPDLIIETGIAHGGSLVYYASLLELIGHGEVVGIDIDIRKHNRSEIEKHSMYKRIHMIEGSAISDETLKKVTELANGKQKIIVCLDSNHTHEHVLRELQLYSPFVNIGSYIIAFDTIVENLQEESLSPSRPWGIGNNPMTAVKTFLENNANFAVDESIDNKLLISVAPHGYLKRIK